MGMGIQGASSYLLSCVESYTFTSFFSQESGNQSEGLALAYGEMRCAIQVRMMSRR